MALRRSWWGWWSIYLKLNVLFRIFIYEMSIVLPLRCHRVAHVQMNCKGDVLWQEQIAIDLISLSFIDSEVVT